MTTSNTNLTIRSYNYEEISGSEFFMYDYLIENRNKSHYLVIATKGKDREKALDIFDRWQIQIKKDGLEFWVQ